MTEELGKIEKPEAEQFREKRKLCLVPLLFFWEDAPAEYKEKLNQYWQEVTEHIANLESKIGRVNRIYHESITVSGEEGLKVLEKLNPSVCQIANDKCQSGAELEVIEDPLYVLLPDSSEYIPLNSEICDNIQTYKF